jgi:NAD(P)-dependent dehydrogenase (short-subunit alcohol dehydrogenase family)
MPGFTVEFELPLHGKLALVTEASRGLGEGIAFELARRGASVRLLGADILNSETDVQTGRLGICITQQQRENRSTSTENTILAT